MDDKKRKNKIEILHGGFVSPLTEIINHNGNQRGWFDGGAYYEDGSICRQALIRKPTQDHKPKPLDASSASFIPGSFVFGGMLQNEHFGHFISENLGRAWALDHLGPSFKSIVFYVRSPKVKTHNFVSNVFEIAFPEVEIRIVHETTQFEFLAVPDENLGHGCIMNSPLNKAMQSRLRLESPLERKKIYVSRSRLSLGLGGFLGGDLIDKLFEEEGYNVVYPELMTIREQLEIYNGAERLVFAEGSALHLYALVAKPTQHVFIIWRRGIYEVFNRQIQSFRGRPADGKPSLIKLWIPERDAPDAAHGQAILSFKNLSSQLLEKAYISGPLWDDPDIEKIEEDLWAFSRERQRPYLLKELS